MIVNEAVKPDLPPFARLTCVKAPQCSVVLKCLSLTPCTERPIGRTSLGTALEQCRLTRTEDIVASCSLVWWKYVLEPGFTLSAEKFKIDDPYASVEPTTTNIYVGSEHFRENMSASTSAASEPWVFHPNRQRGPRDRLCVTRDL